MATSGVTGFADQSGRAWNLAGYVENELTGEPMFVGVASTVDEVRAAGLIHLNCRHTFLPFIPGATRLAEPAA